MGIQSTRYVKRSEAIDRIRMILDFSENHNYIEWEKETREEVGLRFNQELPSIPIEYIENLSNLMLGEIMDEPFVRHSYFDNYIVINDDESEKDYW